MTTFQKIYPGFQFIDERGSGDTITVIEKTSGNSFRCIADKSYEEDGQWIDEPYEEYFTETEMKRMLHAKYICWTDGEEL